MKNLYAIVFMLALLLGHEANSQCISPPPPSDVVAESTSICLTGTVELSLSTGYNASYTYQWQNSPNGGQFFDIAGQTGPTLSRAHNGIAWYRCTIRCNGAGQPTYSSSVRIEASGEPCSGIACETAPEMATVLATSTSVCSGTNVQLSLSTTYNNGELIQWQYAGFNGFFINIDGATNPTHTVNVSETFVYRAVITCAAGNLSTTTEAVEIAISNVPPVLADVMPVFCSSSVVNSLNSALQATDNPVLWYETPTINTPLNGNELLVNNMTYYAAQVVDGCESIIRTPVTVTFTEIALPAFADVNACGNYILPDLDLGDYYTLPDGGGTMIPAGTVIQVDTTVYVYVSAQGCSAQQSFTIDISDIPPPPTGATDQTMTSPQGVVARVLHIHVTGTNVQWYESAEDAQAGINALDPETPLIDGATYYATQTINGCASTRIHAVSVTVVVLGTNDFDTFQFSTYPNPVTDVLNISGNSNITSVKVLTLLGQELINLKVNTTNAVVNMGSLANGTYLVNVEAANGTKTARVVKK
ncbi:T9SS type A sorting domain-containing protein [Flavobacterium sp. Sd200]|uniref:T9SS type A sorting domain-containing protein n=1 Tax=Flavobacterium sp. Sd200 TaxID=2692211 RepID=UPI00136D865B|nr:T9SS type A sorting domain-containing protein [Flavobacterium sp. Sd200]MXN92667.1 T9SS type A sorting domain-containing protein [Flavobacterium sp. Sd200]